MFAFLAENIGTILVGLAIAGIVTAIIASMARNRKKGKCSSCGSCEGCPSKAKLN